MPFKLTALSSFGGNASPQDPFFTNVELLLPFNESDGFTTTDDQSNRSRIMTFNTGCVVDDAQEKFGDASLRTDGAGEIHTPDAAGFEFGSNAFTVECHVRWDTSIGSQVHVFVSKYHGGDSHRAWRIDFDQVGGNLRFIYSIDGAGGGSNKIAQGSWSPVADTWYHLAADRTGSDSKVYADGAVIGTLSEASAIDANHSDIYIGNSEDLDVNMGAGWIDNVRITNGTARYQGAFTAPIEPYPTR